MLATAQMRLLGIAVFFIFIFLSGFWLTHSGQPYNTIVFNIHKFAILAAVVFFAVIVYRTHQQAPLTGTQITTIVITFLFLVAASITGGLVTLDREMPIFVARLHLVLPILTVLSSIATLFLLVKLPAIT
ncbi:hypothetical protein ACFLYO_09535 [Chloroflexota bacterium]